MSFLFTFFIYNIYFLWEKTSAWGHSNPATYVLKTEGDYSQIHINSPLQEIHMVRTYKIHERGS